MRKTYFENLDALRFLAFIAIFLTHGVYSENAEVKSSILYKTIDLITLPSWLGVPFFYCLSGFLITYLLLVEQEKHKAFNIKKFYMRRILRIWPLYYAVVFFGFFVFPFIRNLFIQEPYSETATLWKYLLFLSNFDQNQNGLPYGAGLGVTWSLSVEEQFYLVWPLLLLVVPKIRYKLISLILFVTAHILLATQFVNYHNTLGSMADLSIGTLLAVICFEKDAAFDYLKKLRARYITLIYFLGLIHLYCFEFGYGYHFITSLFMAFVIFEQSFSENSIVKLGKFKTISKLGTYTYGFYLLHTIANFIVHNILRKIGFNTLIKDLVAFPILSLLLTFVLGYLSYRWLEMPFLALKRRYSTI